VDTITALIDRAKRVWAQVQVLLQAVPARAAAVVGVLTIIQTQVVPVLPGDWGVKVTAWIAGAVGIIGAIVRAVARVTPVEASERGVLPPS
jgi:hypothetical protein